MSACVTTRTASCRRRSQRRRKQAGAHTTDPELIRLADAASLTPHARDLFYRSVPQIDSDRALFEAHCNLPNVPDSSVELACYAPSDNRIFILRIDDPQLKSEMVVAAAHEMLHAAYRKMTTTGTRRARQRAACRPANRDERLAAQPAQAVPHLGAGPGEQRAALHPRHRVPHSDAGAGDALRAVLRQPAAVVSQSEAWESVFSELKKKIQRTEKQIRDLRAEMADDRRRNNIAAYNSRCRA